MKREDIAPPYTAITRHGMFPTPGHDESARFNFLANLNKYVSGVLGRGNAIAYETRVLPAFIREHGRLPQDRFEIRRAMNRDLFHRFWSAVKRNSMEMRQQTGRAMVLRQIEELNTRARRYTEQNRATLELDPSITTPYYQTAVDIHCMPGSYHGEDRPGDVSAGANYDAGLFVTTAGGLGSLSDGGGQALAGWIRRERPDWTPHRILDVGCTIGHNVVPLAQAFPDSEVIAIDTAAPVLRYGHARAQSLGVRNLRFVQANAENLSRWPSDHFDWVQTTMFLHELSATALTKVLNELYRVLAPGGLALHLEQPQYSADMSLYEQFIRDWDAFNNNEPFWSAMHGLDLKRLLLQSGFEREDLFTTGITAVVDSSIFPQVRKGGGPEDYGRTAAWNAYGAWKGVALTRKVAR